MNPSKMLLSEAKFNALFDHVMAHMLKENYEASIYSCEQIQASWQVVRQRLDYEKTLKTNED